MKILAQRPTHRSAVATVLLITKRERERGRQTDRQTDRQTYRELDLELESII